MGLLLVGVLAGILIGFAWLAPSGHLETCTFQWQGCFDHIAVGQPAMPQGAPLRPDPPTPQAKDQAKDQVKDQVKYQAKSRAKSRGESQARSQPKSEPKSEAVQKAVGHSSANHSTAEPHKRLALAKEAVQPTRINVGTSERRPAETSDPVLERAKAAVATKMENPESVEFSDMDRAFRKNTLGRAVDTICGHVRGKNASGGNTGERPFLYLVKEDDVYVGDGKPDSAAAIAYRNICN